MIGYIVSGIVLIAISIALFSGLWKASKYLVIPLQVVIFIVLIIIIAKVFFTKKNIRQLNAEINKSGIIEAQKKALTNIVTKNTADSNSAPAAPVTPAAPVPAAEKKETQPAESPTPQSTQENKKVDFVDML